MDEIANAKLSHLIGDIYDCALDPSLWPLALEEIGKLFDARQVLVFSHEPLTQKAVFAQLWGIDPAQMAADGERYAGINPFMSAGWHTQIDEPVRIRTFMDPEELRLTRFYKEYMCNRDWFDFAGATIQKSAQRYTVINALRGKESGETTDREVEIMGLLAPHVRRAVTIHETIDAKDHRIFGLAGALDLAPNPIFLLDRQGVLQETNRAGEHFLSDQALAIIAQGRLQFANTALRTQLAAVVLACAEGRQNCASTATLKTADGRCFAMELLPLTSSIRQADAGKAVVALFVQEVGAFQPLPGEVLVKLYGLTPAETRLLVLLAQAMTLREAADALGAGANTVKTHLKNIFAKTGCRRQAEVIKLAMSALPQRA